MSPQTDGFGQGEFSERVDRAASKNARMLQGFALGRGPDEDLWRLYLNADLTHFLEFSAQDAVHAEETAPGHTLAWVRRDARITETTSRTLPVEFLQGEVRRGFLRGLSGLTGTTALAAPGGRCSGCGCSEGCTNGVACSDLPGGDTIGLSCGC